MEIQKRFLNFSLGLQRNARSVGLENKTGHYNWIPTKENSELFHLLTIECWFVECEVVYMSDNNTDGKTNNLEFEIRAMPQHSKGIQRVLQKYLRHRFDAGYDYVTADDIRRDLEWDPIPQTLGSNLRVLNEEGVIKKWNESTPATYKITLDGDPNG